MTYAVPVRFVQEDPYLCFQLLLTSGSRYLGGDRPKAAKVSDTWIQWPSSRRIFILVVLPYCIEITGTFLVFLAKFELRHYRPASASYRKKVHRNEDSFLKLSLALSQICSHRTRLNMLLNYFNF